MKITKTYHFLSGLPRSGSTVLASILNQNPEIYATPTSPLLDQLISNQNVWYAEQAVKAHPVPVQLENITKRLINAIWNHKEEQIIIDKNRGWGKNMPASTILFGNEIKMIATVRDIPSIMASWLTLLRNNPNSYMDKLLVKKGLEPNDRNRMLEMWYNMVEDCVSALETAKVDASNRLLIVDYDHLNTAPSEVIQEIETFLSLPKFQYDYENILSSSTDDDLAAWGLVGMHSVRKKLEKTCKSAEEILGGELFATFSDIQERVSNGKYKFSNTRE